MNVHGIRRNVKNVVRNYSDAQVKVREATSNDPWGPPSTLMGEIADLSYNVVAFTEIMQMIWKRLNDHGKNWRHVYKALVLLEYLIKTGSEKVCCMYCVDLRLCCFSSAQSLVLHFVILSSGGMGHAGLLDLHLSKSPVFLAGLWCLFRRNVLIFSKTYLERSSRAGGKGRAGYLAMRSVSLYGHTRFFRHCLAVKASLGSLDETVTVMLRLTCEPANRSVLTLFSPRSYRRCSKAKKGWRPLANVSPAGVGRLLAEVWPVSANCQHKSDRCRLISGASRAGVG